MVKKNFTKKKASPKAYPGYVEPKKRKTLTYTAKHFINLEVSFEPGNGKDWKSFFMLNGISSEDNSENELIGEDHCKYACWDAVVYFTKTHVICEGADSPGGGDKTWITIKIPLELLKTFVIT